MNLRKVLIIMILTMLPAVSLWAQQDVLRLKNTSVADALATINEHYPDNSIHFVRNGLDTLFIPQITLKGQDVLEDINRIIGRFPIGVKIFGSHIFVEYKSKENKSKEFNYKRNARGNLPLLRKEAEEDIAFSINLSEVLVIKTLPLLNMTGTTMSLRVARTPLALAGSAFDLLYYLPVQTASPGTVIRIDGKTVTNYAELTELGSEEVERIDYSDQPPHSSRQDIIIDIRTNRKREEGYGIQMASQFSQGERSRAMQMVKTNVHREKWDVQASGTYRYDGISKELTINQYSFHDKYDENSFHLNLSGERRLVKNLTVGAQYRLFAMLNPVRQERSNFSINFDYENIKYLGNVQNAESNKLSTRNWQLDYQPQHDLNFFLKTTLGAWDVNADASLARERMEISEDTLGTDISHRSNEIKNTLWTVRAVAVRPLWNGQLQVSGEYAYNGREDRYHRLTSSESLLREQRRWSGTLSYRKRIRKIEGMAGILGETVETEAAPSSSKSSFSSSSKSPSSSKLKIYPFATISYLGDEQKLMLSYARRSSLPTYGQTNSYAFNNVEILSVVGEPALRPSVIDNLQLKYLRGGFYGAFSFQKVSDFIAHCIEQRGADYCSTYRNLDRASFYSASLNYHHAAGNWTSQYSATLRGQKLDCWNRSFSDPIVELSWNNQFQLSYNITALFKASYHTSGHEGTAWQKHAGQIGITLAKETRNWTLQLSLSDILRTSANHKIFYSKDSEYSRRCLSDDQRLQLTLKIRFGEKTLAR